MSNGTLTHGISKRIREIQFGLLSPDEIRKMSATKIITADTYDDDGFPIEMGLMDSHLGVIEPGLRCKTCGGKVDDCPGHFGHIDLAIPIIHVGFVKDVQRLLESTCKGCGRILLTDDRTEEFKASILEARKYGADTLDIALINKHIAREAKASAVCPHCNAEQSKITLDKPSTFREEGHKLTPKDVRTRLERIQDQDLVPLGLNPKVARPEWMVLTVLPVPPVSTRPSITLETGERSEDDLTHKLVDVLRINQRLRENRDAGAPQLIVEDLWELLQYHVTTYFDNQTAGIPPARHRSGRPLKTLVQRLKGKEGRFRSNLSGKRVNFSARTVISPDPMLSINEVGVPRFCARELTVPVYVTQFNIDKLKEIILRGSEPPDVDGKYVFGANYVIRPDGRRRKINEENKQLIADSLEIGFLVERQLVDGDVVLFNRQPSLHRMSMMAHQVRVMDGSTFRFNLCVCPPYNADFDGDEMNLHVLQSDEARAEAMVLMRVQEHILSPRFGGCVIGGIHDHISGAFILTYRDHRFTKFEVMRILQRVSGKDIPPESGEDGGEPYWTGKDIFSIALPKDLSTTFKASICKKCDKCKYESCEHDAYVKIVNGELQMGAIDEKAIGAFKGKLTDKIARDYGANATREFLDTVTKLAIGAITTRGFTTGISDEDIPDAAKDEIQKVLSKAVDKVNELVGEYHDGTLEPMPGRSARDTLEVSALRELGMARSKAGEIASRHLGIENSAVMMALCGARGSMLNLSMMAGNIGQQAVRGERIRRGYVNRTLPHFEENDLGAAARGFVRSCYKSGLSPTEFFFHAMGGRENLVDTAVKTSRSGYMQRRLVNALEDLKVESDGTVKNTAGTVVQFKYGEDNIDPTRAVHGSPVDIDDIIMHVLGTDAYARLGLKDTKDIVEDSYGVRDDDFETEEGETGDIEDIDFDMESEE